MSLHAHYITPNMLENAFQYLLYGYSDDNRYCVLFNNVGWKVVVQLGGVPFGNIQSQGRVSSLVLDYGSIHHVEL